MQTAALKCIACGSDMQLYFEGMFDDRYGMPGLYDIYRCPRCHQCQTFPLLRNEDLSDLYGNYYPRREIDVESLVRQAGNPAGRDEIERRRREGTDNQGQYLARPGMRVLDYGCGCGASLLEIQALGAEAYGIETDPNVQQVIDALGLRIHIGSLESAPFCDVPFDLIVLNQVIEHIPQPQELLAKFVRLLKPGGKLVLSFPNAGSIYARFFKRAWINWHIPYHLHHFNPRSARLFLEHCGWRVCSLRTITPNLWTVLQCRAAVETTVMGQANPLWTGEPLTPEHEDKRGNSSWVRNLLQRFALSVSQPTSVTMLTFFNRKVDRLGVGDSLLIVLESATGVDR